MEEIFNQPTSIIAIIISLVSLALAQLVRKYIVPYLKIGNRKIYAQYILLMADEVTDDLRKKYPEKSWLKHLDEAVDSLMEICKVSKNVASRAVRAATVRK